MNKLKTTKEHHGGASTSLLLVLGLIGIMGVMAWQGSQFRDHLEVVMRPHLDMFLTPEFDDYYGVTFDNAGGGPALIRGYTIAIGDKNYTEEDLASGKWNRDIKTNNLPILSAWLQPGDAIAVGRHRMVLGIPLNSSTETYERFMDFLGGVRITIDYESFYGKEFTVTWSRD